MKSKNYCSPPPPCDEYLDTYENSRITCENSRITCSDDSSDDCDENAGFPRRDRDRRRNGDEGSGRGNCDEGSRRRDREGRGACDLERIPTRNSCNCKWACKC